MGNGIGRAGLSLGMVAALGLASCGGGGGADGENDQGIVFRAIGFVRGPASIDSERIRCTEPTTQNSIVDASYVVHVDELAYFPDPSDPMGDPCGGYIALENHLATQAINVQEIAVRYEIPGAAIAIPENSITFGLRINPPSSPDQAASGQVNLVFSQLVGQMIPENFMTFLEQNRNDLPATPYTMNAFFRARGQSDAGIGYTTNEIGYQFTITRR